MMRTQAKLLMPTLQDNGNAQDLLPTGRLKC